MADSYLNAACNTIVASRWRLWMARIFGEKVCATDQWGGRRTVLTIYRYRGVLYLTNVTEVRTDRTSDDSGNGKT